MSHPEAKVRGTHQINHLHRAALSHSPHTACLLSNNTLCDMGWREGICHIKAGHIYRKAVGGNYLPRNAEES